MKSVLGRGLSSLVSAQAVPVRVPGGNTALKVEDSENSRKNAVIASDTKIVEVNSSANSTTYVPIADIEPGKFQPRQEFSEAELKELADSIQNHGVLQPVLLRRSHSGSKTQYELIAGERRWRAAQLAGLLEIPALVKPLSDQDSLEIAIIENVQRHDSNPLEEALAYQRLQNEFSLTQEQVAEKVGKERATVTNLLRLLKLSPEVQQLVKSGEISLGHAKALLSIKEASAQLSLAKKVIAEGLSVRGLEGLIGRVAVLDTGTRKATSQISRNSNLGDATSQSALQFPDVMERLRNALATKVVLKHKKDGSGAIEIHYHSENELDRLVEVLSK